MDLRFHGKCHNPGGNGRSVYGRREAAAPVTRRIFASHILPLSGPARCCSSILAREHRPTVPPASREGGLAPFREPAQIPAALGGFYRELDLRSDVDQHRSILDRRMG